MPTALCRHSPHVVRRLDPQGPRRTTGLEPAVLCPVPASLAARLRPPSTSLPSLPCDPRRAQATTWTTSNDEHCARRSPLSKSRAAARPRDARCEPLPPSSIGSASGDVENIERRALCSSFSAIHLPRRCSSRVVGRAVVVVGPWRGRCGYGATRAVSPFAMPGARGGGGDGDAGGHVTHPSQRILAGHTSTYPLHFHHPTTIAFLPAHPSNAHNDAHTSIDKTPAQRGYTPLPHGRFNRDPNPTTPACHITQPPHRRIAPRD
ncbi:hypothetical protein PLICRDRAFT_173710 [Plicaturopsis crispa FD-325 SS-3]|nr:hypothetical protein PLICRDRAFT_173710 [Plicaturopsis crispa FD-325 SS-3]